MVFELYTLNQWLVLGLGSILIGMSKSGLKGTGLIAIPLYVLILGGKPSTGFILPMLIIADVFAVIYYKRHAEWKYILKILPWAFAGIIIGALTGQVLKSDRVFRIFIFGLVYSGIFLMIYRDYFAKSKKIPDHIAFSSSMGLLGGFATMIGNAAGPVLSLYLLSMRLPKNAFIGTGAWFFMIINLSKVPLHVFYWETINLQSVMINLSMAPLIFIGFFSGFRLIKLFPEKAYRIFVIVMTLMAGSLIIIK